MEFIKIEGAKPQQELRRTRVRPSAASAKAAIL
jgi:hypothetical protein